MSVTTAQLLALAKEAADLTDVTDYVTDATWTSWLNAGIRELHRFVTNKFRATYYRTFDFTLTAGESLVTLPSNFWRLKGLDLDPDSVLRRPVLPFNFAERNQYRRDYTRDFGPAVFCADRFYSVLSRARLQLQPKDHAAGTYRLYYTPTPRLLGEAVRLPITVGDAADGGEDSWTFASFAQFVPYVGDTLITANAGEGDNNGTRTITEITGPTTAVTDGVVENESFATDLVATLTANSLDAELDTYSEYVWLTAAIKSLIKEESFAQANMLKDQRNLIRTDLTEALETDSGGPKTIIDTDGDE